MKNIVLIGAGGHGKIAAEIAQNSGYSNISFLDSSYPEKTLLAHWPVVGLADKEMLAAINNVDFFVSIGNNKKREQVCQELELVNSPVLSHSSSIVSSYAKIAQGTLIAAGGIINIGANIGKFVIVNTGASIDHDCMIADFVHISPGARLAGGVSIGARSWVGIGAVVRENVKIGKDVVIGAGAAVVSDIADGARVLGVPAKPVREKN